MLLLRRYIRTMAETISRVPAKTGYNTGEVAFERPSGMVKVRKGQTEEQFEEQKRQFEQTGPIIGKEKTITEQLGELELDADKDTVDLNAVTKIEREKIFRSLERLYYIRQYKQCLARCQALEAQLPQDLDLTRRKNKGVKLILEYLHNMEKWCEGKEQ